MDFIIQFIWSSCKAENCLNSIYFLVYFFMKPTVHSCVSSTLHTPAHTNEDPLAAILFMYNEAEAILVIYLLIYSECGGFLMFPVNYKSAESQWLQGDKLRIDAIRHFQCSLSNLAPECTTAQINNKTQRLLWCLMFQSKSIKGISGYVRTLLNLCYNSTKTHKTQFLLL